MEEEEKQQSEEIIEADSGPEQPAESAYGEKPAADDTQPYPLRKPSEDPKWAVRTVRIWVGLSFCFLAFILILGIFGLFYD